MEDFHYTLHAKPVPQMTPKAVVMLTESLPTSKCHTHIFIMFTLCTQGWIFFSEIERSLLQKIYPQVCPTDKHT